MKYMGGDKKLNIAIIWYFDKASKVFDNWRDGHRAAFEVIEKKHDVTWFIDKQVPDPSDPFDFIILWDDSNSPFFALADRYNCPIGLCLTTMPSNFDNLHKCSIVFSESGPVREAVRAGGIRTIKAFGTDTDFFKPNPKVRKDIPYFYPATFSPWKRQDELANLGPNLYLVGTIQPDGLEIYQKCTNKGCLIEVGYFPASKILKMFQRAENVPIPAVHGSERTVLEAMACDILPRVIHPDINPKTYSYVKEYEESGMKSPREFVLKYYSHKVFAKNLLKGIKEVLSES